MSFKDFDRHVRIASPAFRCEPDNDQTFIAHVRNRLNPPADFDALEMIDRLLGQNTEEFRQFYSHYDGVTLYEDFIPKKWSGGEFFAAGICFFPIEEWVEKSREMRDGLVAMGWSENDFSDWLRHGIAFGEIPHSANYFVVGTTGEHAGKIYYADHDDYKDEPIAESFGAFLDSIIADPADFLYRHGCYTRYCDGETDTQWIPKEFLSQ